MAKKILSHAPAGWQIDLNSLLRNSDQIDSVTSVGSARGEKTLLGVVVNFFLFDKDSIFVGRNISGLEVICQGAPYPGRSAAYSYVFDKL